MTNEGIAIRLDCSIRSIQKWWDDTCPSPQMYHRLWMLEESFKREQEREERAKRQEEQLRRTREWDKKLALFYKHTEEVPHPDGECDECRRILQRTTND